MCDRVSGVSGISPLEGVRQLAAAHKYWAQGRDLWHDRDLHDIFAFGVSVISSWSECANNLSVES